MELSKKTDYALRMVAAVARTPHTVVSVKSVAQAEGIPYSFARVIQHELTAAGIVRTHRGAHGGMSFEGDPFAITVLDVVEAVQGPLVEPAAGAAAGAPGAEAAAVGGEERGNAEKNPEVTSAGSSYYRALWRHAAQLVRDYLSTITLAEAIAHGHEQAVLDAAGGVYLDGTLATSAGERGE